MTGIGFLGAGVIMRERLTVRGLTTAASIWLTAGIGILVGIGFFTPAALTTVIALGALSGFRWIERHVRTESYAQFVVAFAADKGLQQAELVGLITQHGFATTGVTHRYRGADAIMEYEMTLHTLDRNAFARLSDTLRARPTWSSSASRRRATEIAWGAGELCSPRTSAGGSGTLRGFPKR